MTNIIMKGVGNADWERYKTVSEICEFTGFDAYGDNDYQDCMAYLNARNGSNSYYKGTFFKYR